jgi:hypothetical protein
MKAQERLRSGFYFARKKAQTGRKKNTTRLIICEQAGKWEEERSRGKIIDRKLFWMSIFH